MIALTRFRISAYVRSHRVYQALIPILVMMAIIYANRAPVGSEAAALADSAVLIIPVLAWSTRSLLDTEPDEQRAISATTTGTRTRELTGGLLAALAVNTVFATLALACGLLMGLEASPTTDVLFAVTVLHVLAVLAGLTLGALTSRVILPSPALSIMALLFGYLAMLLISITPAYWLTVPVTAWLKAAGSGALPSDLPALGAISLAWCLAGLAWYTWLRRSRP
ncbi:hypothetical protein [Nonomuraea endophytica]|uniref:Xanthosine utilization system XapX-like protein n=1 Tax=Nonomuraea endophytica TaxID=714136 RepID=A0A7W8A6K8_9ACTN|nr:hypothetical protein [Nonomuraea endophytica]MBB5079670.1 xanthosine utilization system XapX-like protein [Nonomuraea endophytica]